MVNKINEIASMLYTEYCIAVGGLAFNGDPLPSWEDFSNDPGKEKQANAWRVVAEKSLSVTDSRITSLKLKCFNANIAEDGKSQMLGFRADYDGNEDNKDWSLWTPVANLTFTVTNPNVVGKIDVGNFYSVSIRPFGE